MDGGDGETRGWQKQGDYRTVRCTRYEGTVRDSHIRSHICTHSEGDRRVHSTGVPKRMGGPGGEEQASKSRSMGDHRTRQRASGARTKRIGQDRVYRTVQDRAEQGSARRNRASSINIVPRGFGIQWVGRSGLARQYIAKLGILCCDRTKSPLCSPASGPDATGTRERRRARASMPFRTFQALLLLYKGTRIILLPMARSETMRGMIDLNAEAQYRVQRESHPATVPLSSRSHTITRYAVHYYPSKASFSVTSTPMLTYRFDRSRVRVALGRRKQNRILVRDSVAQCETL